MDRNCRLVSLTVLALAATLALSSCKKSDNSQANNPQPAQPAAAPAPAAAPDQSASSQPAAQPPAQSGAASQPAAQPASAAPSAAPGSPATDSASAAAPAPAPPQPTIVVLPKGTAIQVRLDEDLGSAISKTGENFRATVSTPVKVGGQTLIPTGSRADGTVTDAQPLGKIKGEARLAITLHRIHTPWGRYAVETSSISRAEKGKGKRTAVMGGGGAGLGAIIGGIAGGGKGALIGGLVGGGAGTAGSAFTGNKQIVLPTETLLTFRLQQPVQMTKDQ